MSQVAVNTAVREEAKNMQGFSVMFGIVDGLEIHRVLKKLSFINLLSDLRENLEHNTACSDVGVTDFGVAHLSCRETDIQARSLQLCIGIFCEQCV